MPAAGHPIYHPTHTYALTRDGDPALLSFFAAREGGIMLAIRGHNGRRLGGRLSLTETRRLVHDLSRLLDEMRGAA